jgi:hypothetical protein
MRLSQLAGGWSGLGRAVFEAPRVTMVRKMSLCCVGGAWMREGRRWGAGAVPDASPRR